MPTVCHYYCKFAHVIIMRYGCLISCLCIIVVVLYNTWTDQLNSLSPKSFREMQVVRVLLQLSRAVSVILTDPKLGSFFRNRLPLPVNPFLRQNSIHTAIISKKEQVVCYFVTILTIDALLLPPTRQFCSFWKGITLGSPLMKLNGRCVLKSLEKFKRVTFLKSKKMTSFFATLQLDWPLSRCENRPILSPYSIAHPCVVLLARNTHINHFRSV